MDLMERSSVDFVCNGLGAVEVCSGLLGLPWAQSAVSLVSSERLGLPSWTLWEGPLPWTWSAMHLVMVRRSDDVCCGLGGEVCQDFICNDGLLLGGEVWSRLGLSLTSCLLCWKSCC